MPDQKVITNNDMKVMSELATEIEFEWRKSQAGIMTACQKMSAARDQLGSELFRQMVETKLQNIFNVPTAIKLAQIGSKPLLVEHKEKLPPNWTSIYQLSKLDDDSMAKVLKTDQITPGMKGAEVGRIVRPLVPKRKYIRKTPKIDLQAPITITGQSGVASPETNLIDPAPNQEEMVNDGQPVRIKTRELIRKIIALRDHWEKESGTENSTGVYAVLNGLVVEFQLEHPRAKSVKGNNQGTRMTEDWVCPGDTIKWLHANFPEFDAMHEIVKFKRYWMSVPGDKGLKADWVATLKNRFDALREYKENDTKGNGKGNGNDLGDTIRGATQVLQSD